jgi:fructokinase
MSGQPERRGRVLVVGEALADVVISPGGRRVHPGGSPANVAVGLARLGVPVTLLTQVGADRAGGLIRDHLGRNAVDLINAGRGQRTGVAQARFDAAGSASYEFLLEWDPDAAVTAPALAATGASCLHTGSIAATLQPGAATVRALLEQAGTSVTISYDPNCRPSQMGDPIRTRAQVESLVSLSHVVKASAEDVQWLYPAVRHSEVARHWLRLGPAIVIITGGATGSWAVARAGAIRVPAVPTPVVDTLGAGDSFTAAVLAGLARRDLLGGHRTDQLRGLAADDLTGLLADASRAAAVTCSRAGADPPYLDELTGTGSPERPAAAQQKEAASHGSDN